MKRWVKISLFCLSCLSLISWDRATKDLAKTHLKDKATVSYMHDTVRLLYVENTGAAMSLGDELSHKTGLWILCILPLLVITGLFVYVIRKSKVFNFFTIMFFSLIIAGGLGNLLDRFFFDRHVADFMNIGIGKIRTGIFNFADVFILAGVTGLLYWQFKHGTRSIRNDA